MWPSLREPPTSLFCMPPGTKCLIVVTVSHGYCLPSVSVFLCRHVLFGFNPDELHCVPRIYILNVCKFYIWHARNIFRFRDVLPSALDLIASVRARVRFHLPFFSLFPLRPSLSLFPSSMGCQGCHCLPPAGPCTHSPLIF